MQMIKTILVPIDFSDYSKGALKYSIEFALHFKADIHLVYVIEPAVYPADFSMGQIAYPTIEEDISERAKNDLTDLAKSMIGDSLKWNIIIKMGKPFYEINSTASEIDADLIIIATHGHTGMEHLLFGSTAEKVVRKAPCPVLSLREPIKGFKFQK